MNEQTLNIKFVQEVEKYPCLYNYKLSDYSRKDVTERAWSEVGKIFNLTESQAKEKWKNFRAVFVRHIKPGPSGSSSKIRKKYYLTDAMQFTIPYIKTLNTVVSGNLPQEAVEGAMDQDDREEANHISDQRLSPLSCSSLRPIASSSSTRCNRRKVKSFSTVDDGIMDYFEARKAKIEKKSEDIEDPKRMFLLSLLPDVKAMSDSQTRTFKRRVLALVDEILEESPRPLAPPQRAASVHDVETEGVTITASIK